MNRLFHSYGPMKGEVQGRRNGVLISNSAGVATQYSLWYLEDRGRLMIPAGTTVYEGMIIGQHAKDNDLIVNVIENKKLTNIRAAGKDESTALSSPMQMTLEKALAYIEDDELVEVTPSNIRLRKRWLDPNERKRQERKKIAEVA
jgi:GTP-binding protein